eukprot:TRINITY_DN95_c0_g1_i1.p1 TRINITY_DN95_c0_g1~~TRINITY_DN95_c0_g1_i1.p1  ORF type:complete len:305 (+),score=35.28 TRINITY_DN95_c0_g1_i1:67-915(+)
MGKYITLSVVLLFICFSYAQIFTKYDQLYHTFLSFQTMPLNVSEAQSQGWKPMSTVCDPNFGIAYTSVSDGPTNYHPGFLYFTSGGQIAGFGARIWSSSVPSNLIPNYWRPVPSDAKAYDISVMFRAPSILCSGQTSSYVLGDRVSVNNRYTVPQNSGEAKDQGWVMGNCISRMGIHYSLDLDSPGNMTWKAESLFPIMPMYGVQDNQIKAVLIATPTFQDVYPFGQFEGPFTNFLFCLNWCSSSGCSWTGSDVWTTFHWLFTDYNEVTCTGAPCALGSEWP